MPDTDTYWQDHVRDQLRMDFDPTVPGAGLQAALDDYLDHFGDLAVVIDEIARDGSECHADAADQARRILHRHLLVVTMLLERVEAHEAHRAEADWMAANPDQEPAVGV